MFLRGCLIYFNFTGKGLFPSVVEKNRRFCPSVLSQSQTGLLPTSCQGKSSTNTMVTTKKKHRFPSFYQSLTRQKSRWSNAWIISRGLDKVKVGPKMVQGKRIVIICTLWWTNIAMERSTIFNGKIHYFYGHFQLLRTLVHQRIIVIS